MTMTSETKDHVEDDRILNDAVAPLPTPAYLSLLGRKKTAAGEQSDPTDGDRSDDVTSLQSGRANGSRPD